LRNQANSGSSLGPRHDHPTRHRPGAGTMPETLCKVKVPVSAASASLLVSAFHSGSGSSQGAGDLTCGQIAWRRHSLHQPLTKRSLKRQRDQARRKLPGAARLRPYKRKIRNAPHCRGAVLLRPRSMIVQLISTHRFSFPSPAPNQRPIAREKSIIPSRRRQPHGPPACESR